MISVRVFRLRVHKKPASHCLTYSIFSSFFSFNSFNSFFLFFCPVIFRVCFVWSFVFQKLEAPFLNTHFTLFLDRVAFVTCSADFDKFSEDPEFKPASRLSKDLFDEVPIAATTLEICSTILDQLNGSLISLRSTFPCSLTL